MGSRLEKCRYLCQFLSYLRNLYRSEIRFRFGFRQAPQNHRSVHISYPPTISSNFYLTDMMPLHLKFSFSKKATKICAIFRFDIYLVNVKTMRKIEQIFVAFSEKLNFKRDSTSGYLLSQILPILGT